MTPSSRQPVFFDLQATQSIDQRHRGIPRYVLEQARALEQSNPEAVAAYLAHPDWPLPEAAEEFVATGKLRCTTDIDWAGAGLLHVASPIDMHLSADRQVPGGSRRAGVPRVVTLYDLIPYLMPEAYLEDPGLRRRYHPRLQRVRSAAAVLVLSEATRRDALTHLSLDPDRVIVVGSGTGSEFTPPASRSATAAEAAAAVPGLRPPYVFYVGSYEKRKNLEPLLGAWSHLPATVRSRWQLALCCRLRAGELRHLEWQAETLGLGDDVCFTGFVSDDVLVRLHQGSDLFFFPSLYEGYGLPVAEALACGAVVLGGDASSVPEILSGEALFDPTDIAAMTAALERGLTDEGLRTRLTAAAGHPPALWSEVADATAAVYERVLSGDLTPRPRPARPRTTTSRTATSRPAASRIGVAGVFRGGPDAEANLAFVSRLAERAEVVIFAERPRPVAPPGAAVHPIAALEAVEELHGHFDEVVYLLGPGAVGSLAALRRRRAGVAVVRSVGLGGLYVEAAHAGAIPEGLPALLLSAYGRGLETQADWGRLDADEAARRGLLLIRDVAGSASRVIVTSPADAVLARLDAYPADRDKVVLASDDGLASDDELASADGLAAVVAGPSRPGRPAAPSGGVAFDLTALQTPDMRHRGIARYVGALAGALRAMNPSPVDLWVVNPDLALPTDAAAFAATGRLHSADDLDWETVLLLHTPSLFEMGVPLERIFPMAARDAGVPWVVTLHDVIPHLMPGDYLEDQGRRHRYRTRMRLLPHAAAVLTNSAATRIEGITHAGLDPNRVVVAGTGTGPQFVPPVSRSHATKAAVGLIEGLRPGYVLYVGNYEARKNVDGLLEAWARLAPQVRDDHQLVVIGIVNPAERNHVQHRLQAMGVEGSVLLAGFVPDGGLVSLYQGSDLFVFPSLHEGYGLPVAEALACGAVVIAGDSTSLPEIVAPDATFDATDPSAIATAIEVGLTDAGLRDRLTARAGHPPTTWGEVAAVTASTYRRVLSASRPSPRASRRAFVGALPPDGGPLAERNYELLADLAASGEVVAFADRGTAAAPGAPARVPPGIDVHPLGAFDIVERLGGSFATVYYALADDGHHVGALGALHRRPGVVIAHSVHLAYLHEEAARTGAIPLTLRAMWEEAYGQTVPHWFGKVGSVTAQDARRQGVFMTRSVLSRAERFLVHTQAEADLARLDARPADRHKVGVYGGGGK